MPEEYYTFKDNKEREKYYAANLAEMPVDVRNKAIEATRNLFKEHPDLEKNLRELFLQKGPNNWVGEIHFSWGMSYRNFLRTEAGLPDDLLPQQNWDDYYHLIVELALGYRAIEVASP